MKKLIIIISILLISFLATAQLEDIRFSAYLKADPHATYKDGFNIGAGINYQTNIIYVEAQTFLFPNLNNLTYFDLGGGIGLNWHDRFRYWRIYSGGIAGIITRGGQGGYAFMGIESGLEYYFNGDSDGIFIGINLSRVMRSDSKIWSNDPYFMVNNALIKIGFTF